MSCTVLRTWAGGETGIIPYVPPSAATSSRRKSNGMESTIHPSSTNEEQYLGCQGNQFWK